MLSRCASSPTVECLFYCPDDATADWADTDLWRSAAPLCSTTPIVDVAGEDAKEFGATTSGHVLLYSNAGQLRFSGGITPARAHEGDSVAAGALVDLLNGHPVDHAMFPVFGCPIHLGDVN
ncbi:hypothetical protein [Planctomycetes bacterium Pan216]|uniref:hypothetical protein n=1 Tax=Kolteria novifilia TaxID=2527975 RepID=UPI0011A779A0